jgi:hypothetical protein
MALYLDAYISIFLFFVMYFFVGGKAQHARKEKAIALEEYYKNHNITPHH